ncbi:MAG TPA: hypothetical protein VFE85_03130, partial [Woeseiaceae bacterium]|nr:hypothetical protein [Woeseiaceae bacterium]
LFSAGYVVGILRRGDRWTGELGRVNTGMGLVVLVLMLLANSPLLDFRKLSTGSQLARLDAGEVAVRDFDFWFLHNELARPGYLALQDLKSRYRDDAEVRKLIENPVPSYMAAARSAAEDFWDTVSYRPQPFDFPAGLKAAIATRATPGPRQSSVLLRVDLDEDGNDEYVMAHIDGSAVTSAWLYYRDDAAWRSSSMFVRSGAGDSRPSKNDLLRGDISLQQPRFSDLVIGDAVLRIVDPPAAHREPVTTPSRGEPR